MVKLSGLSLCLFKSAFYFNSGVCRLLLYKKIDQKLMKSFHRLLNCENGGLDCRVITTEYRTRAQCIHMYHLFCNALTHVIYSGVHNPAYTDQPLPRQIQNLSRTAGFFSQTHVSGGVFKYILVIINCATFNLNACKDFICKYVLILKKGSPM